MLDITAFERIVADDHARRELLWLRAKEKEDEETVRGLEAVDPRLVGRLLAAGADIEERSDEGKWERRERFGRVYDECYERHAERLRRG